MFTIIVSLTLQENWDVPAVPLRSALAVLIEFHLYEGRKAGNGALRIGDAGLGSAQACENPVYGTGEHHSAVPGTPLASCLVLKMGISSSRWYMRCSWWHTPCGSLSQCTEHGHSLNWWHSGSLLGLGDRLTSPWWWQLPTTPKSLSLSW